MGEKLRLRDGLKRSVEILASHIHRPGRVFLVASMAVEGIAATETGSNAYTLFDNGRPLSGALNVGLTVLFIGVSIVSNRIRSESARNEREINNFFKGNSGNKEK